MPSITMPSINIGKFMPSINFEAIGTPLFDNSPYFTRLRQTPELTEASQQILQKNDKFVAPGELFELRNKLTNLTNAFENLIKKNTKSVLAVGALVTFSTIVTIIAVATVIFGSASSATFFAVSAFLLWSATVFKVRSTASKYLDSHLEDFTNACVKSSEWIKNVSKQLENPEAINHSFKDASEQDQFKETFKDTKEKVRVIITTFLKVDLKEEFQALKFDKIVDAGLNRQRYLITPDVNAKSKVMTPSESPEIAKAYNLLNFIESMKDGTLLVNAL